MPADSGLGAAAAQISLRGRFNGVVGQGGPQANSLAPGAGPSFHLHPLHLLRQRRRQPSRVDTGAKTSHLCQLAASPPSRAVV